MRDPKTIIIFTYYVCTAGMTSTEALKFVKSLKEEVSCKKEIESFTNKNGLVVEHFVPTENASHIAINTIVI